MFGVWVNNYKVNPPCSVSPSLHALGGVTTRLKHRLLICQDLHSITRPMLCYCKCYRAPWPSVPPACQSSSPAQWVLTCSSVHFKWTRKAIWGELTHYYNRLTAGLDLNMCIIFELPTSLRCSLNTSLHTQGSLGAPDAWLRFLLREKLGKQVFHTWVI